ncbi:DUF1488 domain-containing protein [Entomohabitans teleogrylli]|uniref:DUF1488 domain-containing protein n=1 Tax=Entomohabitans teleogrylli TaxID=1384589 RepID=UPI00073D5597|nr:DUF1488 domain-containing protein [Entomohabitans teleogrylli]
MNQAIQFPDREEWDEGRGAICFPVLVNGIQLTCAIRGTSMAVRFGGSSPAEWLERFQAFRWDLEEEAQSLIEAQREDDQGWVWLP